MPTDHARRDVEVHAPLDAVLATIRDLASQPEWIPTIQEAEVLETDDAGLPLTARFAASTAVGTDRYTLAYEHAPDGMSWSMVEGRLQTGQEGVYTVEPLGADRARVTYDLTIHHNLPLPGFIRSRIIKGLVDETLTGLRTRLDPVS
ncbi:SRPBCC family protein [Humibacillus xanthopallidus]|uniref:Polyketide cyclase/dehydrase/lipid transport protein n=1 Tax=Humibacillus xanthopallidus TaxID=412689 RepID=A0A543I0N7_9MICO|nr:SRPBCC family protein [Humibacillus xanthopallidus]TQM64065.1 polyketide cyclase/dehydrase/lipid transport protein [Humibacillus xanthopallidus]